MSIKNKKGFTLIELIIVVIIIAILSGVAFANYQKAFERARDEEVKTALRMIQAGQKIYKMKNNSCFEATGADSEDAINDNLNLNLQLGNWHYEALPYDPAAPGDPVGQASRTLPPPFKRLWRIALTGEPCCYSSCLSGTGCS